jgi:hypothetical protein
VLLPRAPQASPASAALTQEEIEFNEQFRKWQEEFDNWKQANINHPDKVAYRQYEQQFESVRQKLVQVKILKIDFPNFSKMFIPDFSDEMKCKRKNLNSS